MVEAVNITDLCVYKEEGDLGVVEASFQHDAFEVFSPLCIPIVFRQLNLETLIIRPEEE